MQEGLLKMQVLVIKGRLKQEITSAHKLNQVAILQNKNTVFIWRHDWRSETCFLLPAATDNYHLWLVCR